MILIFNNILRNVNQKGRYQHRVQCFNIFKFLWIDDIKNAEKCIQHIHNFIIAICLLNKFFQFTLFDILGMCKNNN